MTPGNEELRCFTVNTGDGRLDLTAHVVRAGGDWNVTILGGDSPHIGAAAIALPRESLEDPRKQSASSSVFCVPGHKEDALTKDTAERLAAVLMSTVAVTAGMHWNGLQPEDIETVTAKMRALEQLILRRIQESSGAG